MRFVFNENSFSKSTLEKDVVVRSNWLNSSSITPTELCRPVLPKALRAWFKKETEVYEADHPLPLSVAYMLDAIWCIGKSEYDFPERATPIISDYDDGRYLLGFAFANDAGTEDSKNSYVDPQYMDDVEDYLTKMLEVAPDHLNINIDDCLLMFRDKKVMYELLCNMIAAKELFGLHQPEEMYSTISFELPPGDVGGYLKEKHWSNVRTANEEDPDFLLTYTPQKPFTSIQQYKAEALKGTESPFMLNMGQIYELMVLEGERDVTRRDESKREYFAFGIN